MTDLALVIDAETGISDLQLSGGALATHDGLRSAILVSLFTDARAGPDADLPEAGSDRRGWWGDGFARDPGDETGSLLWLLRRGKLNDRLLVRAREYAAASLAWITADQVASNVDVRAELAGPQGIALTVTLDRPNGPARERFDFVWENS